MLASLRNWSSFGGLLGILTAASWGCSKDEKDGKALGIPQVKPPVETSTPNGIKNASALRLTQETSPLATRHRCRPT